MPDKQDHVYLAEQALTEAYSERDRDHFANENSLYAIAEALIAIAKELRVLNSSKQTEVEKK